ncbi:TauD/TfdA family dioxygenase [Corallococcus sp. AS-1-12]|uniref:TauD/TfdA family dioxygenase n=1 Tax=Corallococcus sp. AS-1-12 TaxID=2874598 RepID=UPI001CBD68CC|nr:TauD/TfdA family dioxygenase [Corallococcus sp. AS-1-12]
MTGNLDNATWPVVITPGEQSMLLEDWVAANRDGLEQRLTEHKALLFRGFGSRNGFESIANSFFDRRLNYTYRSTPRTDLGQNLYTATEYPKQLPIPQHCENAYQRDWPMRLLFNCVEPASRGGRTPLADMSRVTAMIPSEVQEEFERKKVRYVRNYRAGVDLPWQEVFGTSSKAEVEKFCADHDMECQWTEGGLRTIQVCQAFAAHPLTGERIWFNQAHLFHLSALDPGSQKMMLSFFGESGLPRNSYFGDGSPIGSDVLEPIRSAFDRNKVSFEWRKDDVLLIDNMLVSHGRDPFEGSRRVLVCMAEPYSELRQRASARAASF